MFGIDWEEEEEEWGRGGCLFGIDWKEEEEEEEEETFTVTTSLTFTITTSEHTITILHKTAFLVTPQQCNHKPNRGAIWAERKTTRSSRRQDAHHGGLVFCFILKLIQSWRVLSRRSQAGLLRRLPGRGITWSPY